MISLTLRKCDQNCKQIIIRIVDKIIKRGKNAKNQAQVGLKFKDGCVLSHSEYKF